MSRNDREADLNTAMALTQRFLGSSDQGLAAPPARPSKRTQLGQALRYWLWRAGGRKRSRLRDTSQIAHLLDNYEIELERLRQAHERDLLAQKKTHDQTISQIQESQRRDLALLRCEIDGKTDAATAQLRQELEREQARVRQLEDLAEQFQRVYKQELAKARQAGQAEMHPALEAAQARVLRAEEAHASASAEQQEQLASQRVSFEQRLGQCLDEARREAETIQAGLRRELQALQAARDAAAEQAAEAMAQLHQDHQTALDQARRTHETALGALRTAQAEELAEMRIAGEWALGDAKRQIADLRLRLTEQDENHAEELEELHAQHKQDLASWLSKFEAAQQHQEIRHAGEYAGSTQAKSQALIEAEAMLADQARALSLIQAEKHREATAAQQRLEHAQAQAAGDLAAAETRFDEISAQFDTARQRLADLEQRLDHAADRECALADQVKTLTSAQTGLHETQDRVDTLDRLLSQTRQRLAETEQRLAEAAERENALIDQITLSEDETETARARIVALEQHLAQRPNTAAAPNDAASLQAQLAQTQARLAAAQAQLVAEQRNVEETVRHLGIVRAELQEWRHKATSPVANDETQAHQEELRQQSEENVLTLARLRLDSSRRIAELERLLAQAQTISAPPQPVPAPTPEPSSDSDWQARARAAQDRAERAQSEAQLAANKIEVLKDALAIAKAARPGTNVTATIDTRFRHVKRAFARAFHPDQGGREHPDKAQLFLEFWPVFERIESECCDD